MPGLGKAQDDPQLTLTGHQLNLTRIKESTKTVQYLRLQENISGLMYHAVAYIDHYVKKGLS